MQAALINGPVTRNGRRHLMRRVPLRLHVLGRVRRAKIDIVAGLAVLRSRLVAHHAPLDNANVLVTLLRVNKSQRRQLGQVDDAGLVAADGALGRRVLVLSILEHVTNALRAERMQASKETRILVHLLAVRADFPLVERRLLANRHAFGNEKKMIGNEKNDRQLKKNCLIARTTGKHARMPVLKKKEIFFFVKQFFGGGGRKNIYFFLGKDL